MPAWLGAILQEGTWGLGWHKLGGQLAAPCTVSMAKTSRGGFILLFSACLNAHLKYCTHFCFPNTRTTLTNWSKFSGGQQAAQGLALWGKLKIQGLFSLEKRWLWGDLAVACLYLWWGNQANGSSLFKAACERTSATSIIWSKKWSGWKIEKGLEKWPNLFFLTLKTVNHWNGLSRKDIMSSLHPWRISGPHWIKLYTIWFNLTDDPACNRRWKYRSPEILPAWIILWSWLILKSKYSLLSDDTNLLCSLRVPVLWPILY